jgi:hypothetical protein
MSLILNLLHFVVLWGIGVSLTVVIIPWKWVIEEEYKDHVSILLHLITGIAVIITLSL